MGQAVQVLTAVGKLDCCGTWARYVFNAAKFESDCGCCNFSVETQEVVVESDSDVEVEIDDCCHLRA